MANESDKTENEEAGAAEAVYRQYQRTRAVATTVLPVVSETGEADVAESDEDLAHSVYQNYQQSRKSDNESTVDQLMLTIEEHTAPIADMTKNRPEKQPVILNIDAKLGQVASGQLQDAPAANNSSMFKRLLLPAVAAAVFSIALVPLLLNKTSEPEALQASLPSAIIDNAEQSVAYLDEPATQAFGLTGSVSSRNNAFNAGVTATELELLVVADNRAKLVTYAEKIFYMDSPDRMPGPDTDSIAGGVMSLRSSINMQASGLTLKQNLNDLKVALEETMQVYEQLDWYRTGQSVESIRLAAEYALGQSDIEPLEQALAVAAKMDYPTDYPALIPLLEMLATTKLSSQDDFQQARELLGSANNIKVLMQ